jgi:hypothetical protein
MKAKLRNITITLEESIARWARIEAARKDTSVSRFLAGILKDQMGAKDQYESAAQQALNREPFLDSRGPGPYLSRDEAHARPSRTERLVSEIEEAVRESAAAGIVPVDENTKRMAIKLASLLPPSIPAPEIAFDPDGEISFDWLGPANKIFSVSVDRSGRLAYAGRFGEKKKNNGVEQLSDVCPPEIIQGIERAAN